MRTLACALLCLLLPRVSAAATGTVAVDLEALVSEAIEAHPSVAAARAQADALHFAAEAAGAWHEPMLSLGINNLPYNPLSLNATPMSGVRIGVQQTFVWPGKTELQRSAAEAKAHAADATGQQRAQDLALAVRLTVYDIHLVDISQVVLTENLKTLGRFVQIADAKYRVGRGDQRNVLRARVAQSQLQERIISLTRQRVRLLARLGHLLARPSPLVLATMINVPMSHVDPQLSAEGLLDKAIDARPHLRALQHAYEQSVDRAKLADKAALPDMQVGLSYTFRGDAGGKDPINGADFLGLSVGFGLPVFYATQQAPEAEARHAQVQVHRAELQAAHLRIRERIHRVLGELPAIEAQMQVYERAIIPNTQQALDAELAAYQVDRADFLDLLDLEMKLLAYQIDFHRLHAEHEKLLVQLAAAVGVPPKQLTAGQHMHHSVKGQP